MHATAAYPSPCPVDALIQRELPAARQGDHDAYGRIVDACQNTVTAVALAITRDVQASEDIAQEAFLNAWQHLERLHSPDSFLPWLRQITRNLARDHLRRYRNTALDGPNAELAMAVAADPGPQPMEHILSEERESTAFELISALPDDSRETLLLFYREGQSSQQVALLLGLSDAAVRKRLSRARQLVRDDLLQRFGEFAQSSAPSVAFAMAVTTALGAVSKPAAASALAAGGAVLGGSVGGKAATGLLGIGGAFGLLGGVLGGLLGGWLGAHLTCRFLLAYADTLEERRRLLDAYNLYLWVTLPLVTLSMVVTMLVPHLSWAVVSMLVTEAASLWTLLRIRNQMLPLIARDRARDPVGARRRYRNYDLSYGPTAIIVTAILYFVMVLALFFMVHHGADGIVNALRMLGARAAG